jgi:hypothetical protein
MLTPRSDNRDVEASCHFATYRRLGGSTRTLISTEGQWGGCRGRRGATRPRRQSYAGKAVRASFTTVIGGWWLVAGHEGSPHPPTTVTKHQSLP